MSPDSQLRQSILDEWLAFNLKRSDEDVAATAISRLSLDVPMRKDAVNIKLEQGWKTLIGQVVWH